MDCSSFNGRCGFGDPQWAIGGACIEKESGGPRHWVSDDEHPALVALARGACRLLAAVAGTPSGDDSLSCRGVRGVSPHVANPTDRADHRAARRSAHHAVIVPTHRAVPLRTD